MRQYLFFVCFLPLIAFGQKQGNIWYFGDHAGLDFNTGSPVVINDGQTHFVACPACHSEGTSVIADSSGSLLFYCDGRTLWNSNHQIMRNGDSLLSDISSTQSSLILPEPGNSRYFYVFTTDDFYMDNLKDGFQYSRVDICLDDGLGGVIRNQKNILLLDSVCEKLTAVRHSNGVDYWVIVHKFRSDAFYSYRLTSSGITDTVISYAGSVHTSSPGLGGAQGQMKASPDGKKLALVNGNVTPSVAECFDFDKSTGVISNMLSLQTNPVWGYYGVSFSPDNSKLYLACTMNGNGIYQFDLAAGGGNPADVLASKTLIAGNYNYLGLQLASDGKIYAARSPFGYNPYLGVINDPNWAGTACNFVDSAVYLDGHSASYGFPNFVDSYDYSNTSYACGNSGFEDQEPEETSLFPDPFSDHLTVKCKLNEQISITLYNCQTQPLLKETFRAQIIINTSDFPSGLYLYELRKQDEVIARGKLIKY
jgi:hypothetical protein